MRAAAGSTGVGGSGREPGAALAPASGENGATGARAHAKPEAVGLRPAPIVRLERPLAHRGTPHTRPAPPRGGVSGRNRAACRRRPQAATTYVTGAAGPGSNRPAG